MNYFAYDSCPAALDALCATLKARKFELDGYHIVLTPDRYTLAVETALFSGGGAIDCEVLTLSRLTSRVAGERGQLSKEAGVMLTARAVSACELTYFARAARYSDFAREAFETLLQIESSGVSPEGISASGVTAQKLGDLAKIKAEYEKLKGGASDSPDRLKELISAAADSALVKNSHFYAIGYQNATKLNRDVFEEIAKHAKSFDFYDALPPEPRKYLSLYCAPDAVSEYKAVAAEIKNYIFSGGSDARYGDVSVVCPEPRALMRILGEYGIPFYADETRALFDTPPVAALYALYSMRKQGGGDFKTVVAFAKNPYSRCAAEDAERLEVRLAESGVVYDATDFECDDERARRAIKAVDAARRLFDAPSGFVDACNAVMAGNGFEDIFGNAGDGETDGIKPVRKLLDLVNTYGAGDFDGDADAFFAAARAATVKSLPRKKDRVSVCMPQSLRMTRCKKLFVTDFNEGVLPVPTAECGLLSDAELAATGGVIEPTARDVNRRERRELAAVVANADDVFIAYSTAGGARKAAFISELVSSPDGIRERGYVGDAAILRESDDARFIAKFACTASAAREVAARRLSAHGKAIELAVGKCAARAKPFVPNAKVKRDTLSVSELTHWFYCPYKRFLSDSVGLKERRNKRGAADFGLVMHEFMRRWIKITPLDDSPALVESTVTAVLDEFGYLTGSGAKQEREKLIRDACDYASLNKRVIEAGEYVPTLAEKPFGGEVMLGKNGDVRFVGVIDRVDVHGGDARIIDYKTGNKKFELKKCRDGRDMQLPLYAAAIKDKRVTGVFYLPAGPMYDADGSALSGAMIRDERVALDYDANMENGERSDIIAARLNGKGGFYRPSATIMPEDGFDSLIADCVETASVAADEINSGYIERTPAAGACEMCAFGALCYDKKPRVKDHDEADGNGEGEQ